VRLSLVIPYYRNPTMLQRQFLLWRDEWSAHLKEQIEIIIVDDGSPAETAEDVLRNLSGLPLSLYRVTEDRPWHQHGARNLGAHVATGEWLLMTDMDHIVPGSTLAEILRLLPELSDRTVLTFGRVDAPRRLIWFADEWTSFERTRREDGSLKPHVNSFAISKKNYWRIGGYDEDLCGIYGTDGHFRKRLFGPGSVERHLSHAPLIRVDRDVINDASTRNVERKTPGRTKIKQRIVLEKLIAKRAITTLNFPWEKVL